MDAIVTAGEIPNPKHPLYPYSQGQPKALIDVAGKPMIQWVLDALGKAQSVSRVIVVGLAEKVSLKCRLPLHFVPDHGDMIENIIAGTRKVQQLNPQADYVLLAWSDIPAITPEMVDWVVEGARQNPRDVHYHLVPYEVMQARFPASKHKYFHLKDVSVTGGDLNVVAVWTVDANVPLWKKMRRGRRSVWLQLPVIGLRNLIKFIFRRLSLEEALREGERLFGVTGRVELSPYAEIGMDVDTPHHLHLLRDELASRTTVHPEQA